MQAACFKKELNVNTFGLWYFTWRALVSSHSLISSGGGLDWCFHWVISITGTNFTHWDVSLLCYKSPFPLKTMPLFSQGCLCSAELLSLTSFSLDFLSGRGRHALEMLLGAPKTILWLVFPLNLKNGFFSFPQKYFPGKIMVMSLKY